ncbi:MAG: DNA polymerase domain-containing protein [Acidimicrobiales bacterium]
MSEDPQVSNPNKVMFPEPGYTKADVVGHYRRVAEPFLAFAAGRPLTLQRFPGGLGSKGFMQKNAGRYFPDAIARFEVPTQDGGITRYPVIAEGDTDALVYLVNQGTLTFHTWTTSVAEPDRPDWLVLDLDPHPGDLDGVRAVTAAVGELGRQVGLAGFPVATGSSGFHVWYPLDRSATQEEAAMATRALAGIVAARHPEVATVEFLKKDRGGRVFVDWLRNRPIATVVVPFSLRPKPAAPVAVPLRWDELAGAVPDGWPLGDHAAIDERVVVAGELTAATRPQPLDLERIVALARAADVDLDTPFDRFGRDR